MLGDTSGNLSVQVNTNDGNAYDTKVAVKGNGNDIALSGNYYHCSLLDGNSFNMALAMNALSLASIQGIAMNQIRNSSGFIRGNLQLQGTPTALLITSDPATR